MVWHYASINLELWFKVKRVYDPMLTIGVVAKRSGIRSSAIRYYEAHGLLSSQRLPNGYRLYDENTVAALRFIRRAQAFGMTLAEIRELMELSRRGQRPCNRVKELVRQHLQDVEIKLRELHSLRRQLQALARRPVPARATGKFCPIIEEEA